MSGRSVNRNEGFSLVVKNGGVTPVDLGARE